MRLTRQEQKGPSLSLSFKKSLNDLMAIFSLQYRSWTTNRPLVWRTSVCWSLDVPGCYILSLSPGCLLGIIWISSCRCIPVPLPLCSWKFALTNSHSLILYNWYWWHEVRLIQGFEKFLVAVCNWNQLNSECWRRTIAFHHHHHTRSRHRHRLC